MTNTNIRADLGPGDPFGGIAQSAEPAILVDLSLNENRLGPSEHAIRAFNDVSLRIWKYPDGSCALLKTAIASRYGITPEQIVCGAGADELITLLTRIFASPGKEVLFPEFSFIMFPINALRVGAVPVPAPTSGFAASIERLVERINDRTGIIFLANPNNPTGTYLLRSEIIRLAGQVPTHIPLVLDGAYAEYLDNPDYTDGRDLLKEFPNLVILRSFSKIFGLASLRIGWCCASQAIAQVIERFRGPYNVSGPAQAAAIAALQDDFHVTRTREHNQIARSHLRAALGQMGLTCGISGGNFLMPVFSSPEAATQVFQHLRQNGILVRRLEDYNLPSCLRITVGCDSDNDLLLSSLKRVEWD